MTATIMFVYILYSHNCNLLFIKEPQFGLVWATVTPIMGKWWAGALDKLNVAGRQSIIVTGFTDDSGLVY